MSDCNRRSEFVWNFIKLAQFFKKSVSFFKKEICGCFGLGRVYYIEKDIARIARYCQKDVLATARLYQRLNNIPTVEDGCVFFVE